MMTHLSYLEHFKLRSQPFMEHCSALDRGPSLKILLAGQDHLRGTLKLSIAVEN